MYRRILVPLDGSRFGDYALPFARALAERTGATLMLVHVHEYRETEPAAEGLTPFRFEHVLDADQLHDAEMGRQELERLERIAATLAEDGVRAEPVLLGEDAVGPALNRYAERSRADLVVLATHGRGGLSRAWIGSVADFLVRHLSIPLLVVRPPSDPPPEDVRPRFQNLLVTMDGSLFSERVLGPARQLAAPFQSRVTLLRVIQPHVARELSAASTNRALEDERATANDWLQNAADEIQAELESVSTAVVVHRSPVAGIAQSAQAWDADVIAMATHGRGGVARFILGSVADKVLRSTSLPLLLYRPPVRASDTAQLSAVSFGPTPMPRDRTMEN